jgi:hypothetical protein
MPQSPLTLFPYSGINVFNGFSGYPGQRLVHYNDEIPHRLFPSHLHRPAVQSFL